MKTIWRTIKWGTLILVTLLAVASIYLYWNIDSQLKIFVQNKLLKQLPGFVTEIDSAQLVPSKGIIVRGVSISVPGKFGKAEPVLTIQEAFISCDVDLQTVLSGNAKPTAVKLQKLTLHLIRGENGQICGWEPLKSLKSSGDVYPVEICESDVIYRDLRKPHVDPIGLTGLNVRLMPPVRKDGEWEITGKMANHKMGSIECLAKFSPQTKNLTLSGNAKKIIFDSEYFPYLPHLPLDDKTLESFHAKLDFQFEAEHNIAKNSLLPFATAFRIQGSLYDGRVPFPHIVKHPIADIRLDFDITHDSLQISNMSATSGESHLKLDWRQLGLFSVRHGKLDFSVGQFRFDKQFLPSLVPWLPQQLNDQLVHFEAEGQADLSGVIHYNGRRWGVESTEIRLEKLAVTYEKFPYRLDNLQGTIAIAPCEMQAQDGQRFFEEAMTLRLESQDPKTVIVGDMYEILSGHPHGKFEITAVEVAIDNKLKQAIPPSQQTVVQSLNADGNFDAKLVVRFSGSVRLDDEMSPDLLLQIMPQNCSMRYDKFRWQLRSVCGVIEMKNGYWTLTSLKAQNGSSVILGDGHLRPTPAGGMEFQLNLSSEELNLNDELIAAFEDSHRRLLTDLNISGRAGVKLSLNYLSDTDDFHVAFDAETDPAVTTIKPVAFPLLLDTVTCRVRYFDGMVQVNGFRGRKSDSFLSTDLRCVFRKDGAWVMTLDNLLAERFERDTELIRAMPPDLQNFITKLQLKEPVTLGGTLCFQKDAPADAPLRSYWHLGIICHQNSAMLGVPLTNICGMVKILGKNDENGNTVFGKLELDSVNYGDYQLTNVHGPFSFHENTITFGRGALLPVFAEQSNSPPNLTRQISMNASAEIAPMITQPVITQTDTQDVPNMQPAFNRSDPNRPWLLSLAVLPSHVEQEMPVVASMYDGEVRLDGSVIQGHESMSYLLQTRLHEVNLERATRETLAEHPFKGKLSGVIHLDGGASRESMRGNGELFLREADIYKLPTMQRIMQLFGVRSRDDDQSAICQSDVVFSLSGNSVTLSDVQLDGNVLSLNGTGNMDMDTMTISLDLGTQLASRESQLPVISDLINETGRRITEIHVGGSLKSGDLSVRTTALPGIRNALQAQQDGPKNNRPVRDFFRNTFRLNSGTAQE
ncbi:MAG: hypothetical protein FWH27_02455 [Planctomycetaceae bacterium]|nr:hypothetical protein [Planctomycetaceae bacterium]